jgi:hypothetical protein
MKTTLRFKNEFSFLLECLLFIFIFFYLRLKNIKSTDTDNIYVTHIDFKYIILI